MEKINVKESIVYKFDSKEDLSQAVLALGENGYFSDTEDFSNYEYGTLTRVISDVSDYSYPFIKGAKIEYRYFITEDAVVFKREEPKKLRPFKSMREFFDTTDFDISQIVHIKKEVGIKFEETTIFNGFRIEENKTYIIFGFHAHTFEELAEFYKYNKDGEWQPFGIEE